MCLPPMAHSEIMLCKKPCCQAPDGDKEVENSRLRMRRYSSNIEQGVVCGSRYEAGEWSDRYGCQRRDWLRHLTLHTAISIVARLKETTSINFKSLYNQPGSTQGAKTKEITDNKR